MSIILHEDSKDRVSLLPILNHDLWALYKKHESSHWIARDIDFAHDVGKFKELPADVQKYIRGVLCFFASSDLVINRSIEKEYAEKINILEAKIFFNYQEMMENIHTETYSLLIEAYFPTQDEKEAAQTSALHEPTIKAIISWMDGWINSSAPITYRILVNAIYEWVLFTGKFCAIFWICKGGKLTSLKQANEYISRDESIHVNFSVTFYNNYINPAERVSQEVFHKILAEAIELETKFINHILPVSLIGMNSSDMIKYIKNSANILAEMLCYEPMYPEAEQPFDFMKNLDISSKNNFFERPVTQYQKGGDGENVSEEFLKGIVIDPKSPKFAKQ